MNILILIFGCTKKLPDAITNGMSIQSEDSSFVLTDTDIEKIEEKEDHFGCSWTITLKSENKEKFAEYTAQNLNKKIDIVLHNQSISSPTILEPILEGVMMLNHGDSCANVRKQLPVPK